MTIVLVAFAVILCSRHAIAQDALPPSRSGDVQPSDNFVGDLTSLLQDAVGADGLVDYDVLAAEHTTFQRVLKSVENYSGPLITDNQKLAFWINAYNVQMLKHILENPSVGDIIADGMADAFFKTPVRTAGHAISLDEIEHVILRRDRPDHALAHLAIKKRDPRIHVALNCAAVSCPALQPSAFTAEKIDEQLDVAMRAFVNAGRHFRVDGTEIVVSSLLEWFAADWDLCGPAGEYLLRFMDPSRAGYDVLADFFVGKDAPAIREDRRTRFEYDWTVNRVQ